MSYKFILGSNPLHEQEKRKQYIVCLEPHTAVIQVERERFTISSGNKVIGDYVHRGVTYRLILQFLHVSISHFQPDSVQVTQMPTDDEITEFKSKMLRNAWHWYKSVLGKSEQK